LYPTQGIHSALGSVEFLTLLPSSGFYLWTTHNSYFQLATEKTIAMGGGEGKVGLWLNEDFSGMCALVSSSVIRCGLIRS